jgi:hypothetical protein
VSLPKTVRAYSSALGPADCVAGAFHYDAISGRLEWSDELYTLHGYRRGEIVPTVELLYAHKHPDDRERCHDIFMAACEAGGFFCSYHRIIDARKREHRVLTAGEALVEGGRLVAVEGFIVDLTSTLHWETERAAREAVEGALGTRSIIEQAKGILVGILRIGSAAAFDLLAQYSQDTNIKVASTAADLVRLANSPEQAGLLDAFVQELRRRSEGHAENPADRGVDKDGVPSG